MKNSCSKTVVFGNAPSFFKGLCFEASQGGINGYRNAGNGLAKCILDLIPKSLTVEDWEQQIEGLEIIVAKGENNLVLNWLNQTFPRLMMLVPNRRHDKFVEGFCDGIIATS